MTRLPAKTNSTTVADGTTTSSYIPIYGLYMSSWLHTQILYPAEMLGDMVGGTISEISLSFNGYGIFLDNIIVLNVAPPVIDPTVVTYDATNVTSFSAELNGAITDPGNQTILNSGFEWKVTGPNSFQMVSVTGNPLNHVLTGLIPNTNYSYRAIATTTNGTVYGELKTFTTLELSNDTCETPTNLHPTTLAFNSITVTWTDNAGATQWNLQYRLPGSTWTSAVVTGAPTYTITDLQPNTQYEIQVQAICESSMSE
ncbi:MAG: fibronectin type III domain-containing protein, partial [Bacteroidales bacterium]|nr:fibronectin type III domain-containing protein [Bacteroidales bacterium]